MLLPFLLPTASATVTIAVIEPNSDYDGASQVADQLNDSTVYDVSADLIDPATVKTAADLSGYDVVIMGDSGYGDTQSLPAAFFDSVADFNAGGGGVIAGSWMYYFDQSSYLDITPIASGASVAYCSGDIDVTLSKHEVTAGVSDFTDTSYYAESPSAYVSGATVVATADCNGYGVATVYEPSAAGRQAYLGILYFGNSSDYDNSGLRSGDADTLLENIVAWVASCADADADGVLSCAGDCDDNDATTNPDAVELCDGIDNDCDGAVDSNEQDTDSDGYFPCEGDCDDADAAISPDAAELCDGIDNDCDGKTPDDELDLDGDAVAACDGDCDDLDAAVFPGNVEICDALDNDCNGTADDGLEFSTAYTDADGDGYGDDSTAVETCAPASGTTDIGGDCDDTDGTINPDGTEVNDNDIDEDCDGELGVSEETDDGKDASCASASPGAAWSLVGLGLLALVTRRRR